MSRIQTHTDMAASLKAILMGVETPFHEGIETVSALDVAPREYDLRTNSFLEGTTMTIGLVDGTEYRVFITGPQESR